MNVMISELKARLSTYLDAVRRGETVTVLDRRTPIARLTPLAGDADDLSVSPPSRAPAAIEEVRGVRTIRPVDIDALLAESRSGR